MNPPTPQSQRELVERLKELKSWLMHEGYNGWPNTVADAITALTSATRPAATKDAQERETGKISVVSAGGFTAPLPMFTPEKSAVAGNGEDARLLNMMEKQCYGCKWQDVMPWIYLGEDQRIGQPTTIRDALRSMAARDDLTAGMDDGPACRNGGRKVSAKKHTVKAWAIVNDKTGRIMLVNVSYNFTEQIMESPAIYMTKSAAEHHQRDDERIIRISISEEAGKS